MTESDVRKRNTTLREPTQQAPNSSEPTNHSPEKKSLWSRLNPSLLLENKGSVARDHLANERTFLAWIRTSLSLITVGVAIAQLFRLPDNSHSKSARNAGIPIGATFIAFGICFTLFALVRYFHTQALMIQGNFPASRGIVIGGTLGIIALLISLFVSVLVLR